MHNARMLPSYLMLDLETTGGNPSLDRIIEIAAVRVEEGREVVRSSTLVNPGTRISPFITSLTGIDNAMVRDAPAFADVASRLLELLDDPVLVAHNVRLTMASRRTNSNDWRSTCAPGCCARSGCHASCIRSTRAAVQDEADLHEVLSSRRTMPFDVDIYGLLRKRLAAGGKSPAGLIRFDARQAVDQLQD